MSALLAAVLTAGAILVAPGGAERSVAARLRALDRLAGRPVKGSGGPDRPYRRGPRLATDRRGLPTVAGSRAVRGRDGLAFRHHLASGVAGVGAFVVVGGSDPPGQGILPGGGVGALLAALVTVWATRRWLSRLETRDERERRERLESDLPVAVDLLGACLLAGCQLVDAVEAVAEAMGEPVRSEFRAVTALVRLGGDPSTSWRRLGPTGSLTSLGRTLARAVETGAPLAEAVIRLADDRRAARRWEAEERARRVGVRMAAPLGLCFLPAFLIVGVVPVIVSLARTWSL